MNRPKTREQIEKDLDAELRFDFEQRIAEKIRAGIPESEAHRATRLEFGGLEQVKEECRDARGGPLLDSVLRDVRYAWRNLRRSPGFTLVAVLMLAIGIGVNATVFSITNGVLFKGFPLVERNDRLLYLSTFQGCCASYPDFQDWREQAKSFTGLAIVHGVAIDLGDRTGYTERHDATEVSADTFKVVGQKPILGRDFAGADELPGAPPAAILSYSFWESRYAKDPGVIGRIVRMNRIPTTVIGVMPRGFTFPQRQDVWIPLVVTPAVMNRANRDTWMAVGRLAEGVTIAQARAEMEVIGKRLASAYPLTNQGFPPRVETFEEFFLGPNTTMIYGSLWGAVGFVLLIACANLANLMLARALGRSREISVRMALGSGRWRVVRQLLIESVLLSSLGGFLGWLIAQAGLRLYDVAAIPVTDQTPGTWFNHVLDFSMDYRVFAYLLAISIVTGILFGLPPAMRLSKLDVNATLKDGGRGATVSGPGRHLTALLVIGEMALAVVLLAGAGTMIRSFLNLSTTDLGVNSTNLLTASLELPNGKYPSGESKLAFYDRLKTRLEAIPGVEALAMGDRPGQGSRKRFYELAGVEDQHEDRRPMLALLSIGPDYFRALGTALVSGREFNNADGVSGVPAAIVNQRFASQHWPGENPLAKRLRLFNGKTPDVWLTVVGVAPNIVQDFALQKAEPLLYVPYRQRPSAFEALIARTRVPPGSLAPAFRTELQALDSDLSVPTFWKLDDLLKLRHRFNRSIALLFAIFAAIALLLASIGLYAVIAHSVSQRTQELGIRTAIGATAGDVLKLVVQRSLLHVALGLALGLAAWWMIARVLKSELVQASPVDPLTLAMVAAVLILCAILGCLIPARRAMRVDPAFALRHE